MLCFISIRSINLKNLIQYLYCQSTKNMDFGLSETDKRQKEICMQNIFFLQLMKKKLYLGRKYFIFHFLLIFDI